MRILVIGMVDSVHLARWLAQFRETDHEFYIISSSPHRRVHPTLDELIRTGNYFIPAVSRYLSLPLWLLDRCFSNALRGCLLAWAGRAFRPQLVHVLEFQNGGYTYLKARSFGRSLAKAKLLLTPYGSDIYWFRQFPSHLAKLRELITLADGFSSECLRDEKLALELGFSGVFGPRIPAFGGIELEPPDNVRGSRNIIAIKGYQNRWGQALNAISALQNLGSRIEGFDIVFFSSNLLTIRAAKKFQALTGLSVTCYKKGELTHEQVLAIFRKSVAYIGLSKSDGISASMIEAMANGAIPIQSDTSCCGEWLDHGLGGFLVGYDDIQSISSALLRVIGDVGFQSTAAKHNFQQLKKKLHPPAISIAARNTYSMLDS